MTEGKRRKEEGEERAKGRGQKGRLIQERDRWGLAWVGMNRVAREKSLGEVLFPGRNGATFGNRVWELARDLEPVGAYWTVYRRALDDGGVERYLALTEIGYRQAELVLGRGWFQRKPVEKLKPSHVAHDLELADFALALLPKRKEEYQPKVKGKAVGPQPENLTTWEFSPFDRAHLRVVASLAKPEQVLGPRVAAIVGSGRTIPVAALSFRAGLIPALFKTALKLASQRER